MKTNYTTKQFAQYLRKLCEECDDSWRVTKISESSAAVEYYGPGPWFFFNVSERDYASGRRSECGVYVGPKRAIFQECVGTGPAGNGIGKADEMFERRLRACLAGKSR